MRRCQGPTSRFVTENERFVVSVTAMRFTVWRALVKTVLPVLLTLVAATAANSQEPVIDMHLHALPADFAGPERTANCASPDSLPTWDQRETYQEAWQRRNTEPACDDPVWAPETDQAVMDETITAMERLNIVMGAVSGTPDDVERWVEASQGRLLPGLLFELGVDGRDFSVAQLRELHRSGRLAIFGEIANQYSGIAPADDRMEPFWAMAEELAARRRESVKMARRFGSFIRVAPY